MGVVEKPYHAYFTDILSIYLLNLHTYVPLSNLLKIESYVCTYNMYVVNGLIN